MEEIRTKTQMFSLQLCCFLLIGCISQIYGSSDAVFYESFDESFEGRWVVAHHKAYTGEWKHSKSDGHEDYGLLVSQENRKYAIVRELEKPVVFKKDTIVLQFEVRFQNGLECGGAYLKYLRPQKAGWSAEEFVNGSPFSIMFGPNICGSTNKLQFVFSHRNPKRGWYVNHYLNLPPSVPSDKLTHVYTAILKPDSEVIILVDGKEKKKASLLSSDDFKPALIPNKTKPDLDHKKPKGWDVQEQIPNPEAKKPEDWDEDADTPECESANGCGKLRIPNKSKSPYKGKWHAPLIDNPAYKGIWKPREIPNPDYFELETPSLEPVVAIGIEIWSMQDGILFDNILIASDEQTASSIRDTKWLPKFKTEVENQTNKELADGFNKDFQHTIKVLDFIKKAEKQTINSSLFYVCFCVCMVISFYIRRGKTKEHFTGKTKEHFTGITKERISQGSELHRNCTMNLKERRNNPMTLANLNTLD